MRFTDYFFFVLPSFDISRFMPLPVYQLPQNGNHIIYLHIKSILMRMRCIIAYWRDIHWFMTGIVLTMQYFDFGKYSRSVVTQLMNVIRRIKIAISLGVHWMKLEKLQKYLIEILSDCIWFRTIDIVVWTINNIELNGTGQSNLIHLIQST